MQKEIYNPVSTYRIQFNRNYTLKDAEKLIPYLEKTGIRCIYGSPIFQAVNGSLHGYDVTDPTKINEEIGTEEEFSSLIGKLKRRGIGWIQDIVPNHMAFSPENPWIRDLLRHGRDSRYHRFFDLLHDHPGEGNKKLLLPFFGKEPAEMISDRELQLTQKQGELVLQYYDTNYPLSEDSYPYILAQASNLPPGDSENSPEQDPLPAGLINDPSALEKAIGENDEIKKVVDGCIEIINKDPVRLKELIALQHYEPVHWKETENRAGYRRFFTINGLICLQIQEEEVFEAWHAKLLEWTQKGWIDGLRVDHIDGLYDPEKYLRMLRNSAGRNLYIIVEKILEEDEKLPTEWPIQGTTGYDFLGMVNNLLTNGANEAIFRKFTREWSDEKSNYSDISLRNKRFILYHRLNGELDFLAMKAARLLSDYNNEEGLEQMKHAIGEFLVHCPIYKIYNAPSGFDDHDRKLTESIFAAAKKDRKEVAPGLEALHELFSIEDGHAQARIEETDDLFRRCMQFAGPLMAKGIEDTVFYSFSPFIAHNEVGDSPGYFGIRTGAFHQSMEERFRSAPLTMNATSTHDTKRGADARARLNVLSDIPDQWVETARSWRKMNSRFKSAHHGNNVVPSGNDEYYIYQSLFAHLSMDGKLDDSFRERFNEFIIKALREAKIHSSWSEPDTEYEQATIDFIASILAPGTAFSKSLSGFVKQFVYHGINNSMTQLILRNTVPGIPDNFQGSENWNLDFVDPDNRKEVGFGKLSRDLNKMTREAEADSGALLSKLASKPWDGKIKQWVNHKTLKFRAEHSALFRSGSYHALKVQGKQKRHIIAFARQYRDEVMVVILPLNTAAMNDSTDWGDTSIILPDLFPHHYRNIFTGSKRQFNETIGVAEVFRQTSFSVLQGIPNQPERGSGILMHISSLPGEYGTGDFGPEARKFIDFLHESGQRYWQVLPLNTVDKATVYSPYSSSSAFAGNPLFIDPYQLEALGLITPEETDRMKVKGKKRARYSKAARAKSYFIGQAYKRFSRGINAELHEEYSKFLEYEKAWLDDFALFMCLKDQFNDQPWNKWPDGYRLRQEETIQQFAGLYNQELDLIKFTQFLFSMQWKELKQSANDRGIDIFGDIPIYIDFDSADVWSKPEIFQLNQEGEMLGAAGVPPDYFNEDGQHWGMPLFNWEAMEKNQFEWWMRRIRKNLELFDLLRLDHFRGFSAYWDIPAGAETAREGKWVKAPGETFFDRIKEEFPDLPLVAEDLGMIDDDVYALRDRYDLPGMKVVQFGFGEDAPFTEHHPLNIHQNSIAYTGTHDNNTVNGWFRQELDKDTIRRIGAHMGKALTKKNVHLDMIRIAYASQAKLVIIPMQDWLGLNEKSRMNFPSTVKGNWKWKLRNDNALDSDLAARIREYVKTFGRY